MGKVGMKLQDDLHEWVKDKAERYYGTRSGQSVGAWLKKLLWDMREEERRKDAEIPNSVNRANRKILQGLRAELREGGRISKLLREHRVAKLEGSTDERLAIGASFVELHSERDVSGRY